MCLHFSFTTKILVMPLDEMQTEETELVVSAFKSPVLCTVLFGFPTTLGIGLHMDPSWQLSAVFSRENLAYTFFPIMLTVPAYSVY